MTIIGQSLRFFLSDPDEPDRTTTRLLQIAIDDEVVWPVAGLADAVLDIQLDDLLAFLAEHWKPLLLRQTYPAELNPSRLSQLRADASKRWDGVPAEIAEREEEAVLGFEEAHDLSRAFAGLFDLPSFWILRSGGAFRIESQERLWVIPYDRVVGALTELGDQIVAQLLKAGDKWAPLLAAWDRRTEGDGARLLAWATGVDPEVSRALISEGMLEEPTSFADAANDNDEIRIAARMAGALPLEQMREIIQIARSYPKIETAVLDKLAIECSNEIGSRWSNFAPYVQGQVGARFVRDWLEIEPDAPCDIYAIHNQLRIAIKADEVEPDTFDGLAIWGTKHGPGVFLNLASVRVSEAEKGPECDPALRVTLAHELCHLLLDGGHAISAVDVLKSRMPVAIEQRAKSFAGELLLPARTAARRWEDMGAPRDRDGLRHVLREIEREFVVPRAVATWKLDHGLQQRDLDLSGMLASLSRFR